MRPRDAIRIEAAMMGVGDTYRILCPFCGGGQSGERSMNITRTADGVLYNCHRAGCTSRPGFVASGAGEARAPQEREPDMYTGELIPLRPVDEKFFLDAYGIVGANHWIKRTEYDEYILPIFDADRNISGYNVRQPWPGAPLKGRPDRPKSRVYAEAVRPVQSIYGHFRHLPMLLVEDQLSALKAAQHANVSRSIALMGSHLDIPRVQEIAKLRPQEVLLALDKDATAKAFELAREYGLAFPRMRVVILDRDIKDTPADEINEALGL
jgi:hypothetical protein